MQQYHINEFVVDSEITLPCAGERCDISQNIVKPKVTIRRASLAQIPCTLRKVRPQLCYDVGDGVLIEPRTGSEAGIAFHVDHTGKNIVVDTADANLNAAGLWIIHIGLAAATLFRGGLTLHGSALEIDGKYFAIMAESGVGKSTLTWNFLRNGARFGSDDMVPIHLVDGVVACFPSVSLYPKLHRDTADFFGLDISTLPRAIDTGIPEEEYWVPLPPERRLLNTMPLAVAFLLKPFSVDGDAAPIMDVSVKLVPDHKKHGILLENLQGVWVVGRVLNKKRLWNWASTLAQQVALFTVHYPRTLAILPTLTDKIWQTVAALQQAECS